MLIEENTKRSIDRENEYKNKINKMNNKIYENVNKHQEYITNSPLKKKSKLL